MKKESKKAAALKYRHGKDSVPTLIAKGEGKFAEQIIEIAKKNNVPIQEDEDLVEFLSTLDLYQEISADLYKAVAEILAFVYGISKKTGVMRDFET